MTMPTGFSCMLIFSILIHYYGRPMFACKTGLLLNQSNIFLKAVERSVPTTPMGQYLGIQTGQPSEGHPWQRDMTSEEPESQGTWDDIPRRRTRALGMSQQLFEENGLLPPMLQISNGGATLVNLMHRHIGAILV